MEESHTANILLCMSNRSKPDGIEGSLPEDKEYLKGNLVDYIRDLVKSEASQKGSNFGNKEKLSEHDDGSDSEYDDNDAKQSNSIHVDDLRKERNRMHAKLTRDRKKMFTSRVQQMIHSLERQNSFMKNRIKSMEQTKTLQISDQYPV